LPPPNADWKFDEQSGYYYDNNSGYYDYNSGFYFDPATQNYYQYDHTQLAFIAPGDNSRPFSAEGIGHRSVGDDGDIDLLMSSLASS